MPFKEHPIPQNITTYKFRLVGNMTLQQFFEVAGGFIIAFILWKLPLYPILKYPPAVISALLGIAMAFLPLEERPLDVWILSFLKSIYKPTIFIFRPRSHVLLYQTYTPRKTFAKPPLIAPARPRASIDQLTQNKKQPSSFSSYVNHLFQQAGPAAPLTSAQSPMPAQTAPKPTPRPAPQPKTAVKPIRQAPPQPAAAKHPFSLKPTLIKKTAPKKPTFDTSLPKTTQENLPVGIVVSSDNQPLPGTIVEVKTKQTNMPVRVTKTNLLGQFFFANPLPVGEYIIEAERDGYKITPISLTLNNTVLSPIKIIAQPLEAAAPKPQPKENPNTS
ncbi:MAG: hypothetical protein GXP43_02065 [bacterium]|nr:hypothetical protein [bacterium]